MITSPPRIISTRKKRSSRLFVCLLFALLLLIRSACAAEAVEGKQSADPAGQDKNDSAGIKYVDPIDQSDNYSVVLYDNTTGLPTSEANAIAQTSEGFIWIGSYGGLIRYDGNTFERMDSTNGVASVVSLHVDKKDRLWIGTNDSGLALMDHGEFRKWNELDGLASSFVCAIEEDTDGTIYAGTTSGITMVTPKLTIQQVKDRRISGAYIETMSLGADGLLYCLTTEDVLFTLRNGKVVDYIDHAGNSFQGISWVYPDPDAPGELYIGTEGSGVYRGKIGDDPEKMEYVDISPLAYATGIWRIGDKTWICAQNGIGVLDSEGFHPLTDLPMNSSVRHVMADYEGNLWFTSTRQGVMKMVSNQFLNLFERFELPACVVNSTCMLDGSLFVGTDTGLLVLDDNGPVSAVPLTSAKTASGRKLEAADLLELLDGCRIRSIIRDSRERLWISTWKALGLLCYDHGKLTVFTEADGFLSDRIRSVCETADKSSILAACTGGVCVIKDGRVVTSYGRNNGVTNPEILSVAAAPNGDILLGSDGGGIFIIGKESTRLVNIRNGLSSGVVMRIKYDSARDLFWIVTSNSIAYMTADYKVTTVQNFPYSNNFDLYENSMGDMWILSSDGLYVLPTENLIANGSIRPVHYGIANGLPSITTANSYSELTPDGDLYIAGASGVSKININTSLEDITDLKQAVPYIDADGELIYPDETGAFTLPSGVRKLTVYAFIYNYSLTDPQVTYCLKGFDREPVTVSRSELGPVYYTNLPGGSYQFEMELKDALGRGSRTLSVPIVKEKALYEHVWFYVLTGLCLLLLLTAQVRHYIRRKMRAMEEKHREEAVRARISNELHMANRIQASMLPHDFPPFPDRKEFDIFASMDPAREVGGDFYDFYLIDDDHLCLLIADVSDKGIPSALFMMVSKAILQSFAAMSQSAAEILTRTNDALCSNNQTDMFVTVWLGVLEISSGRLVAANAGHEYPVLKRAGNSFSLFRDNHGLVVGGVEGVRYKEYEMVLSPGDKLFVYTDGVPEATNTENEMFGTRRMVNALNEDPNASPRELLKTVRSSVDAFANGAEQFDDLTMLCLEYKGKQPPEQT